MIYEETIRHQADCLKDKKRSEPFCETGGKRGALCPGKFPGRAEIDAKADEFHRSCSHNIRKEEVRKMQIYEELQARGLIAQVTDEEEIRELINNGKATFYIGFDPTADSLHEIGRASL